MVARFRILAANLGLLFVSLLATRVFAANWNNGQAFRFRELAVPPSGRNHLTEVSSNETGITFRSDVAEDRGVENSIRLAGTGVAAGDVDGDGRCDLFFCSMGGKSVLYRNFGNWKFEDITASAGVACEGQDSTGAVFADVDGDGDLDLLVNSIGGGTRLFLNDGRANFTEALNSGLLYRNGSISMTLADVDGNGTLDLYVVNYAKTKIEDRPTTKFQTAKIGGKLVITALDGVPITSPELTNRYFLDAGNTVRELGEPDTLYLNDGHGNFTPVSWTSGFFLDKNGAPLALPLYDWGLSAMFHDMNGDSLPDLYVCNDLFTPDRIWINDGHGHFRELPPLAMRQSSLFSMGIDFADINRDGYDDFFVADMLSPSLAERKVQVIGVQGPHFTIGKPDDRPQSKRNTLFLNRGDNTYAEIGQLSGLSATGWSWSPVFLDVDLDGYDDLLVTTGYYRDALNADAIAEMKNIRSSAHRALTREEYREIKKLFPKLPQQNKAFRNRGDLTFEDKSADWGFKDHGISQGICVADLDNDGDLDVIVVRQNAPVALYKNESDAPRIAVRLLGKPPNTRGIGAKIKLFGAGLPESQEMICGGRYLCADDCIRTFAAPTAAKNLQIEVTWRNGTHSIVEGVQSNRLYEIDEAGATAKLAENSASAKPIFEDFTKTLNHIHIQPEFDDFQRQPTLAQKLSQSGPGVTWAADETGRESLLIGCATSGHIAFFQNRGSTFADNSSALPSDLPQRDATTILSRDKTHLIVGFSNYEDAKTNSTVHLIDFAKKTSTLIASIPESVGPLARADVNGDGELDLFIGGRVSPGRYPEPANSYIFLSDHGEFKADTQSCETLARVGLVSGAIFSDLDNDGFPELIVACEWGPVRVFHNDHGKFIEKTRELGLAQFTGLWNGIVAGDFDGDGRMDFVASNMGRNTKYEAYRATPLRLYYGAAIPTQEIVCFVSSFDHHEQKWLPHCDYSTAQKSLRGLFPHFATYKTYSLASMDELLEGQVADIKILEAASLESTVFLNRGDRFETQPLPIEAQFAPAFGISVADFDGDGAEDIFLSQNFFGVDGSTARYDAGRGLLLKGRGDGHFTALTGDESGIKLYGEQRGCAVADYDADGRIDLAVAQNGAATALFHNQSSPRGLRFRLTGPPGNPNAIGAIVRVVTQTGRGPAHEIHAGCGWLSQDSPTLVIHSATPIAAISVKWPGAAGEKIYSIEIGATSIELSARQ